MFAKCHNGKKNVKEISYRIAYCQCQPVVRHYHITCECAPAKEIAHMCHHQRRKVVLHYAVRRRDDSCEMRTHTRIEKCREKGLRRHRRAAAATSDKCKCYVFGQGHVITYGGRHTALQPSRSCKYVLAKGHGTCQIYIEGHVKNGQFVAIVVYHKSDMYHLGEKKRLYINGAIAKVPFEKEDIRVFYSGEYLQFVSIRCKISVGFNGLSESFLYFNKQHFAGKLAGLCGTCHQGATASSRGDNQVAHHRFIVGECHPHSATHTCQLNSLKEATSHRYCGDLSTSYGASLDSPFAECPNKATLAHIYNGCVQDVCQHANSSVWQRKLSCRAFALAAEACATSLFLPKWRRSDFCPIKCAAHQHYSFSMRPCPMTCDNHFFGTELKCFALPKRDGCECDNGYILDGAKCVRPEECRCLSNVCIDRFSHQKCKAWKDLGRCRRFPRLMGEFCRVTCGLCQPKCEDQMSEKRCQMVKRKGKCGDDFYLQMCRRTCNAASCECPRPEVRKSPCDEKHKIAKRVETSYQFGRNGKCNKLLQVKYETCGECRDKVWTENGKCDFCKGKQVILRHVQYRQKGGTQQCRTLTSRSVIQCGCPKDIRKNIRCLDEVHIARDIFQYKPHPSCKKCVVLKKSRMERKIECRGKWVEKGKCDANSGLRRTVYYVEKAHGCQCRKTRKIVIEKCHCPKRRKVLTKCSVDGTTLETYFTESKLEDGECRKKMQLLKSTKIPCDSSKSATRMFCRVSTCASEKIVRLQELSFCKCRKRIEKSFAGKCCCPKPKVIPGECDGKYRYEKVVSYELINGECRENVETHRKYCKCEGHRTHKMCDPKNGVLIIETKQSTLEDGKCLDKIQKQEVPVVCKGRRLRVSKQCDKQGTRLIEVWEQRYRHPHPHTKTSCECVWIKSHTKEPCKCHERALKRREVHLCPKKCFAECQPLECHTKTVWFTFKGENCSPVVSLEKREPCCCRHKQYKKNFCIKGKYRITSLSQQLLRNGRCQLDTHQLTSPVRCPPLKRRFDYGMKEKNGSVQLYQLRQTVKNCECHVSRKTESCRWKCDPVRVIRRCDPVRNIYVNIVRRHILRGCVCQRRDSVVEYPIRCDKRKRIQKKHCDRRSGVEVTTLVWEEPENCHCQLHSVEELGKCDCPPPSIVRKICVQHRNIIEIIKKVPILEGRHCRNSIKVYKVPIACSRPPIRKLICDRDSGKQLEMVTYFESERCHCREKTKFVPKGLCNCHLKERNHPRTRTYCEEPTQTLVHITFWFKLAQDLSTCLRNRRVKRRPTECPEPSTKEHPCTPSGKRLITITSYQRVNCQCKEVVKKHHETCQCLGPQYQKGEHRTCNRERGERIQSVKMWVWLDEAGACAMEEVIHKSPLNCRRKFEVVRSHCKGKHYKERFIQYHQHPHKCECIQSERTFIRDCRCPTRIIEEKCVEGNLFTKKLIIVHQWDQGSEHCRIIHRKVILRRCRCPPDTRRLVCKNGHSLLITTAHTLHQHSCEKRIREVKYKRHCPPKEKYRSGRCRSGTSCMKHVAKYRLQYDPVRCRCVWRRVEIKQCRCCGCPKEKIETKCFVNHMEQMLITYFTVKSNQCSQDCIPRKRRIQRHIRCLKKLPPPKQEVCDRETCLQRHIRFEWRVRHCKCVLHKIEAPPRKCCCPQRPVTEKYCQDGAMVFAEHSWKLENGHCKRYRKDQRKVMDCPAAETSMKGACNRKTCQRKVYRVEYVVDKQFCRCRKQQKVDQVETCCCQKDAQHKKHCLNNAMIFTRTWKEFDEQSKTCLRKRSVKQHHIKCEPREIHRSPCNRATCMRTLTRFHATVRNCQCVQHKEQFVEKCCCPQPSSSMMKCLKDEGVLLVERVYYRLKFGHCSRHKEQRRIVMACSPVKRVVKPCGHQKKCAQAIIVTSEHLADCKCQRRVQVLHRDCCCPEPHTRIVCTEMTKRAQLTVYYSLEDGKCQRREKLGSSRPVKSCDVKKISGKCDQNTRTQRITLVQYRVENCVCVEHKRRHVTQRCGCPEPQSKALSCDHRTCLRTVRSTRFQLIPLPPHARVRAICKPQNKIFQAPCCCSGRTKWSQMKCDHSTGDLVITLFHRVFDKAEEKCVTKSTRTVKKIDCERHPVKNTGECNKKNGFAVDRFVTLEKNKQQCKCQPNVKLRRRLCSCDHIPCTTSVVKCLRDGYLIEKRTCHTFRERHCLVQHEHKKKKVVCPDGKRVHRNCFKDGSCRGEIVTIWFEREDCKCVQRRHVKKILCCCPRERQKKHCARGKTLTIESEHFELAPDENRCHSKMRKKVVKVSCEHLTKVEKPACDRKSCLAVQIIQSFVVKDCRCVPLKPTVLKTSCCCPADRQVMKCFPKYHMMQQVQYKYQLYKGECISGKTVIQTKIACPFAKYYRSKCEGSRGDRVVKHVFYELQDCTCKRRINVIKEPCSCPKPIIVKKKCQPGFKTRPVLLESWSLKAVDKGKMHCVRTFRKTDEEPCECPPDKKVVRCKDLHLIVHHVKNQLVRSQQRYSCVTKQSQTQLNVRCPPMKRITTKCSNFQQKIILVHYKAVDCKCRKLNTVKLVACGCPKKNHVKTICQSGLLIVETKRFFSSKDSTKCMTNVKRNTSPVVCQRERKETALDQGCPIRSNNGYYRSILITWEVREGCKCVKKKKKVVKLCHCEKSSSSKECMGDETLQIYNVFFVQDADRCLPRQETVTKEIRCENPERVLHTGECKRISQEKCLQTLTVTEHFVKDCVCQKRVLHFVRVCCTPATQIRHFCDKDKEVRVRETVHFELVPGRTLYQSDDVLLEDNKVVPTVNQELQDVKCPERQVEEKCDPLTGRWTKRVTLYKSKNCSCKRIVLRSFGDCKCPTEKQRIGPCQDHFRQVTRIFFRVMENKCVRHVKSTRQRCACPKAVHHRYCDNHGRWVRCLTHFIFNAETYSCRLVKKCIRKRHRCPPRQVFQRPCAVDRPVKEVTRVFYHLDLEKCSCNMERKRWREYCSCRHLNREVKSCHEGVMVMHQYTHKLKDGECIPTKTEKRKALDCPPPKLEVVPCDRNVKSPNRGFILKRVHEWKNVNCICQPRVHTTRVPCDCNLIYPPREQVICRNDDERVTIFHTQTLRDHVCHAKRTEKVMKIECKHGVKMHKSPCQVKEDGVGYYETVLLMSASRNCQCVWIPKEKKVHVCQCPRPHTKEDCKHGRFKERQLISFKPDQKLQRCVRTVTPQMEPIKCSVPEKVVSKCNLQTCRQIVKLYLATTESCHCRIKQRIRPTTCCCPPPTPKRKICLHEEGVMTMRWIEFVLEKEQCRARHQQDSVRVRCDRQPPIITSTPCRDHWRMVTTVTFVRRGCHCLSKKAVNKERCGCPKEVKHVVGRCYGDWARDQWIGLKFLMEERRCVPMVMQTRRRRCRCPPPQVHKKCVQPNVETIFTERYELHEREGACRKHVERRQHQLPCPLKMSLLRTEVGRCGEKKQYFQTDRQIFHVAQDCRCQQIVRLKQSPCDCPHLYAPQQRVHCLAHNQLQTIHTRMVNEGRSCKKVVEKSISQIECKQVKQQPGDCNKSTGKQVIQFFHQVAVNCKCQWKLANEKEVDCLCPSPQTIRRCENNFHVTQTVEWSLRRGKCEKHVTKHARHVPCGTKPITTVSPCDHYSGMKVIKTISYQYEKCQCLARLREQKCQCACPKPEKMEVCSRKEGLRRITVIAHTLRDCRCIASQHVTTTRVVCPKPVETVSPCMPGASGQIRSSEVGDKWSIVTRLYYEREDCTCKAKVVKHQQLCSCDPIMRKEVKCVDNRFLEILHTRRMHSQVKCRRRTVSQHRQEIECGKIKRHASCDPKTGMETIEIISSQVVNCRCVTKVARHSRQCKCNTRPRLFRHLRCNQYCLEKHVYQTEMLRDGKCSKTYEAVVKRCCCPHQAKRKHICRPEDGVVEIRQKHWKLHQGECVPHEQKKMIQIECHGKSSSKRERLPDGVVRETITTTVRVGCTCKKHHHARLSKWKCPTAYGKKRCIKVPQPAIELVSYSFQLVVDKDGHGRCEKHVKVKRVPIRCPEEERKDLPCKRYRPADHGTVRLTKVKEFIIRHCSCVAHTRVIPHVCRCDPPIEKRICHEGKGIQIYEKTTFVPDASRKRCIAKVQLRKRPVHCSSLMHILGETKCNEEENRYFKVLGRKSRKGCECVLQKTQIPCLCRIPRDKVEIKCHKNNIKELIQYQYRRVSCNKYESKRHSTLQKPRCSHEVKVEEGDCNIATCQREVKRIQYQVKHCQCHAVITKLKTACCCPKAHKTTQCSSDGKELVHLRTFYQLKQGRCEKSSKKVLQPIKCPSRVLIKVIGPCVNEKQEHLMTRWIPRDCTCAKQTRMIHKPCVCPHTHKLDIVFVVDESISSRHDEYREQLKDFFKVTTSLLWMKNQPIRMALVKYSVKPSVALHFHENEFSSLYDAVNREPFSHRSSNLGRALHLVRTKVLQTGRPNVAKLLLLVTDGMNDPSITATKEASLLKEKGVKILLVAVKPTRRDEERLRHLATEPSSETMVVLRSLRDLRKVPKLLTIRVCSKTCPPDQVIKEPCGEETKCIARVRRHRYHYDAAAKACLKTTEIRKHLCCCPQEPFKRFVCTKNNRHLLIKVRWNFNKGICKKIIYKEDVTRDLQKMCGPPRETTVGRCRENGRIEFRHVLRSIENCKCKKTVRWERQRCNCPPGNFEKYCSQGNVLIQKRNFFTLVDFSCVARHNVIKKPIRCPPPLNTRGKCDYTSCQRILRRLHYHVKDCKCRKKLTIHKETCCCPQQKKTVKQTCDKDGFLMTHSHWYEFNDLKRTCESRHSVKRVPVECNTIPRVHYGVCGMERSQAGAKELHQLVEIMSKKIASCHCITMRKQEKRVCGCRPPHEHKTCEQGHLITVKTEYILNRRQQRCEAKHNTIEKQRILCHLQRRIRRGPCVKREVTSQQPPGRLREVPKYLQKVEVTEHVEVGCRCVPRIKTHEEICGCPPEEKKQACVKHHVLVAATIVHRLVQTRRGHGHKKCQRYVRHHKTVIKCPNSQIDHATPCKEGKVQLRVTIFQLRECHCVSKQYMRTVRCRDAKSDSIQPTETLVPATKPEGVYKKVLVTECVDLLPDHRCALLEREPYKVCDRPGRMRDVICRKTCGKCYSCKLKDLTYQITDGACLLTDKRHQERYLLQVVHNRPYLFCQKLCLTQPACQSFDYFLKQIPLHHREDEPVYGDCILHQVNLQALSNRIFPEKPNVGATWNDLKRHGSVKCFLSTKICRHLCRKPEMKIVGKCHCLDIRSPNSKPVRHCYQPAHVVYAEQNVLGKCLLREWKGFVPCNSAGCHDSKPQQICDQIKQLGKCHHKELSKACPKTCDACECDSRFEYSSPCTRHNQQKLRQITYQRHPHHHLCVVNLKEQMTDCAYCREGVYKLVKPCFHGKRDIVTVSHIRREDGSCATHSRNQAYSCEGCMNKDIHLVSKCEHGQVTLTTIFSIRVRKSKNQADHSRTSAEETCCRKHSEVRFLPCRGCPPQHESSTPCSFGQQLHHLFYYVQVKHDAKGRPVCIKQVHTTRQSCHENQKCVDVLTKKECHELKKQNKCETSAADLRRLCRATCRMC